MDFLRELVSQKKSRFVNSKYNLDLTYITPRIIAMAFPAEGIESMFRNKIKHVASFLKDRHKENFLVVNVSSRDYDFSYFNNNVYSVKWPNHYPCPFPVFLESLLKVSFYMLEDKKNVVAVHCLAGKGRTGSFIDALLFSSGLFKTVVEANDFYLLKRAVNVTYSSQIRYLLYFGKFFKEGRNALCFQPKKISKMFVKTEDVGFYLEKEFTMSFHDFSEEDKELARVEFMGSDCNHYEKENKYVYTSDITKWADLKSRDILCVLRVKSKIKNPKLFRVNFNLFFVKQSLTLEFEDLDSCHSILPKDFSVILQFEEVKEVGLSQEWRELFKKIEKKYDKLKKLLKTKEDKNGFLYTVPI